MTASMADLRRSSRLILTKDAALLPRFEDPVRFRRVVAPVSLIDIDTLDFQAGQRLGFLDHVAQVWRNCANRPCSYRH